MSLRVVNPVSGELVREYPEATGQEVAAALQHAVSGFRAWRELPFADRARWLRGASAELGRRRDELATLMAVEMGKPVAQGRAEADKCASVCTYYAEHAEEFLQPEAAKTEARHSYVRFDPLGVVLAVMPWNFPFWQVFRFAAPALMAGNAALLKHASNVPGCALALQEVFHAAGVPAGLFQALLVSSKKVDALIEAREVAAVTLTGSTGAGRAIAARAGQHLKKAVLELGGSDAYLVLADADLPAAAEACAASRLINGGQSCIAAKRFIVEAAVREPFQELLAERMQARKVGDPLDEATEVGPLARHDLRDALHLQVERSLQAGARALCGGAVPDGPGAFYPPTVLTGVRPGMAAWEEETFGPVAAVMQVEDEDEAVDAANHSVFGLGAAVFTADLARGQRLARKLEAGSVFVNAFVKSDPRLPFGGVKESGYGRELSSFGIREFVNVKTVYVK